MQRQDQMAESNNEQIEWKAERILNLNERVEKKNNENWSWFKGKS